MLGFLQRWKGPLYNALSTITNASSSADFFNLSAAFTTWSITIQSSMPNVIKIIYIQPGSSEVNFK